MAADDAGRRSGPAQGDHYYGLVAEGYDLLLADVDFGDREVYRRFIAAGGEPALELACGTGRLLIPYRRDGLEVDGLDASDEMLAICRRKAAAAGVTVRLHQAVMEVFALDRRYHVIYCAVGSLMLLTTVDALLSALRTARAHLVPGGTLVAAVDRPRPNGEADGGAGREMAPARLRRQAVRPADGAVLRVWEQPMPSPAPGIERSLMTYEAVIDGAVAARQSHITDLRPFEPTAFAAVLAEAGFADVTLWDESATRPPAAAAPGFLAVARRPVAVR